MAGRKKKPLEQRIVDDRIFSIKQPMGLKIQEIATQRGMSVNELFRTALFEYLYKHKLIA